MPTYEYECRDCSTRVEAFQKITAEPLTTCEACGGSLRRVLFPVGIVFKGSGFYVTDYRNKENGKSGSTNGTNGTSGAASESKSTEKTEKSEKKETTTTATAAKSD
jgi:putative FmdB family regulatory protein